MFANDHCTGKLNYVKLIRESIWFAMIDSRIDSVRNILIRCTPTEKDKQNWQNYSVNTPQYSNINLPLVSIFSELEMLLSESYESGISTDTTITC